MCFQRTINVHAAPLRPATAFDRIWSGPNAGHSVTDRQACRVTTEEAMSAADAPPVPDEPPADALDDAIPL